MSSALASAVKLPTIQDIHGAKFAVFAVKSVSCSCFLILQQPAAKLRADVVSASRKSAGDFERDVRVPLSDERPCNSNGVRLRQSVLCCRLTPTSDAVHAHGSMSLQRFGQHAPLQVAPEQNV